MPLSPGGFTRASLAKERAEGKSTKEAFRCLNANRRESFFRALKQQEAVRLAARG